MDLGDYGVCPLCLEKGKTVKLLFYRLNFMEVCLLCPDRTCPYPVVDGTKDILVKVKDIPALSEPETSDELYYVNPQEAAPQSTGDTEEIRDRAVFDIEDIDFDAMIIEDGDLGTIIRTLDLEAAAGVDKVAIANSEVVQIQEIAKSKDIIGGEQIREPEGNISMIHGEVTSGTHGVCEIDDAAILEDLLNAVEDQQPFDFDINFQIEQDCRSTECHNNDLQEASYKRPGETSVPTKTNGVMTEVSKRTDLERGQPPNSSSIRKTGLEGAAMRERSKDSRSCSVPRAETKDALSLGSLLSLLSKTTLTESGSSKADELESIEAQLIAHFKKAPITYCRLNRIKAACKHAATATIENKIPVPTVTSQDSSCTQEPTYCKKNVKTYCKSKHTKKHQSCCKVTTDQLAEKRVEKSGQNLMNNNRRDVTYNNRCQKSSVAETQVANETSKNKQHNAGNSRCINKQQNVQSSSQEQSLNPPNVYDTSENLVPSVTQSTSHGQMSTNPSQEKDAQGDKTCTPSKMTKRTGKYKRRRTKEKRKSIEEDASLNVDAPISKDEAKIIPSNKKKSGSPKPEVQDTVAQGSKTNRIKSNTNRKT